MRTYLKICFLVFFASLVCEGQEVEVKDGIVKPYRTVLLSTSLREIITEIHVKEGQKISEGQVLVELQSEKQRYAVSRLEEILRKAEFDFQAADKLFKQRVASREEMFAREAEWKRLKAELGIASAELSERKLHSPLSGVVVERFKEPGEATTENDPILRIMETDRLLLLFLLDASKLTQVQPGQKIQIRFPQLPGVPEAQASVDFIDPEVDSRSGLFRVRLLYDNRDGAVRPGLQVMADFPN